jgi:hypothetical protein
MTTPFSSATSTGASTVAPRFFQLVEADLDDGDAERALAVGQRRREVVAGLAARRADAEEAAAAGRHRVAEIGTEREVFADEAVGAPPVARGEDLAGWCR